MFVECYISSMCRAVSSFRVSNFWDVGLSILHCICFACPCLCFKGLWFKTLAKHFLMAIITNLLNMQDFPIYRELLIENYDNFFNNQNLLHISGMHETNRQLKLLQVCSQYNCMVIVLIFCPSPSPSS
jgi:hypothetical protein